MKKSINLIYLCKNRKKKNENLKKKKKNLIKIYKESYLGQFQAIYPNTI